MTHILLIMAGISPALAPTLVLSSRAKNEGSTGYAAFHNKSPLTGKLYL